MKAPRSRQPWYRRLWHVTVVMVRGVIFLEDTPYRVGMGAAMGIFSAFLPTIGQTLIGAILARLARANVIASLPWSWLSNPATTLPIWYAGYRIGLPFTGGEALSFVEVQKLVTNFMELPWRDAIWLGLDTLGAIFVPTLIGACVMGGIAGAIGYVLISKAVVLMHGRRARKRESWRTPELVGR